MNKLYLVAVGLVIVLGVGIYTVAYQKNTKDESGFDVVRMAHITGQFSVNFPIFVGTETGIFEKYGLEFRSEEIEARISVPALLSGSVEYSAFIRESSAANLQGGAVKSVSALSEHPFLYLVARPGISASEIKTLGISNKNGTMHYLAMFAMEKYGLNAELVEAGSTPGVRALLTQGRVDAIIIGYLAPFDFSEFTILDRFEEVLMPIGIVTTQKRIEEKPDEVARVVDAFHEIARYIRENENETKELLYRYYGFTERGKAEREKVEESYTAASRYFSTSGMPSKEGMKYTMQIAKSGEFNSIKDVEDTVITEEEMSSFFDVSFVQEND